MVKVDKNSLQNDSFAWKPAELSLIAFVWKMRAPEWGMAAIKIGNSVMNLNCGLGSEYWMADMIGVVFPNWK
jgi:hypothetical protein